MAIFLALAAPWLLSRREEARRLTCESHLIALAKANLAYDANQGRLPGSCERRTDGENSSATIASWAATLLPLLASDAANREPAEPRFWPELACPDYRPDDSRFFPGWLGYVANTGLPDVPPSGQFPADWPANGVFMELVSEPRQVASLAAIEAGDGADYTLAFSENVDAGYVADTSEAQMAFVWWPRLVGGLPTPEPELLRINQERGQGNGSLRFARPASFHTRGVNGAFVSGRTQFLLQNIDYLVYCQLLTSHGAEVRQPGSNTRFPPPFGPNDEEQ